jgi:hypothetical protein
VSQLLGNHGEQRAHAGNTALLFAHGRIYFLVFVALAEAADSRAAARFTFEGCPAFRYFQNVRRARHSIQQC